MKHILDNKGPWIVLAIAIVVRAVYLFSYQQTPLSATYFADQAYYRTWALRIAGGDWMGTSTFEQGPLYPYLLGSLYTLGASNTVVMVLQLLSGAAACVLVFACADRLFDRKTAMIAGLLAAVYGPLVYYECSIMKSFLSPLLTMAALYAALRYAERRSPSWLCFAGVAIGLACLVRENHILLLIPALTWVWTLRGSWKPRRSERWMHVLTLVLAGGLALVPSLLHNLIVSGEFVPVPAGGGEVFYMAHGPYADGYYHPPDFITPDPSREHEDFRNEARRRTGRKLSRSESSRYWFREGLRAIAADPARSVKLTLAKAAIMLNDYEVPDSSTYSVARSFIPLLRVLPSFGWIVGLGLLGSVVCLPRFKEFQLPLGFLAAHVVSILITYNFGRFRLGMTPICLLLAARGFLWLLSSWRHMGQRRWIAPLAGTVLAAGSTFAAFLPPIGSGAELADRHDRLLRKEFNEYLEYEKHAADLAQGLAADPNNPQVHYRLGMALTKLNKPDEAIAHLRAAIRLAPDLAEAQHALGAALSARGDWGEAVRRLTEAIRLKPDLAAAHLDLGKLMLNQRNFPDAVTHFQRALETNSPDADTHMWLGIAYLQSGVRGGRNQNFRQSETQFKEAVRIDPEHAESYYYLARVYQHQGRTTQAISQLQQAIRVRPGFPEAHQLLLRLSGR